MTSIHDSPCGIDVSPVDAHGARLCHRPSLRVVGHYGCGKRKVKLPYPDSRRTGRGRRACNDIALRVHKVHPCRAWRKAVYLDILACSRVIARIGTVEQLARVGRLGLKVCVEWRRHLQVERAVLVYQVPVKVYLEIVASVLIMVHSLERGW